MLNLDSAIQLHGLTIFRDFNTQGRFWYMPNAPHLTREGGQPLFQLLVYREDIAERPEFTSGDRDGGGFLTMTVDLAVPTSTLDAVRRELEGRIGGDVDLVPVPFERGSVRVTARGARAPRDSSNRSWARACPACTATTGRRSASSCRSAGPC